MPAELPGIVVEQAENNQAADLAHQQEAEANDVIETTDLDREVPHLVFGNRDQNLDIYDEGDVDIILLDRTTQEQLIADIANAQDESSEGSVGDLLAEMDNVQQNIDDIIDEIDNIGGTKPTGLQTRRSA